MHSLLQVKRLFEVHCVDFTAVWLDEMDKNGAPLPLSLPPSSLPPSSLLLIYHNVMPWFHCVCMVSESLFLSYTFLSLSSFLTHLMCVASSVLRTIYGVDITLPPSLPPSLPPFFSPSLPPSLPSSLLLSPSLLLPTSPRTRDNVPVSGRPN